MAVDPLPRLQAVAEGLGKHRLDAFLFVFSPNLRYLTGFTGSNGALLVSARDTEFFTDPRYTFQAREEVIACCVRVATGPLLAEVGKFIRQWKPRRIGYEPGRMTCEALAAIEDLLPRASRMVPIKGWIERMRTIKDAAEIDLIRRAVATNSRAFELAAARAKEGMRESDLAAELEYRMRRQGAEKPAFETIVAAGARSALPHAQPTDARLRKGNLVVVDMGAMQGGYASDMTRMLHVGAPSAKVRRMHRAVLEAQLAAVAAVRPGITTAHVDRQARKVLKAYGLDRAFIHSTGHGLGLEIHEPPRVGRRDATRLEAGMTITIEPGVYLEGFGGIRIEDTVVVTPTGCEVLTPTPKELRVI